MLRTHRSDEAIAVFRAHIDDRPDLPMVSNALARSLVAKQQFAEAIEVLEAAIELSPDHFELINNLAYMLVSVPDAEMLRPWEAAVMMERVCTETAYRDPRYMHTLSMLWARLGRFGEAIQMAERARALAAASPLPVFSALVPSLDQSMESYRAMQKMAKAPKVPADSG